VILHLENVDQAYGAARVLSGVSFQVESGCIGLLGPNGAGKSTLIKTMLGQLPVSPGRIQVAGLDPAREPLKVRECIGYMPETDVYLSGMNGLELCTFCGELSGLRRRDAMGRAHEVISLVGLDESRYREADGYSTGMRQRLRLACALVHGPKLLILDEPTTGLDPGGREEILQLVDDVAHRAGTDVLMSSHILKDIERTCDSVIVLKQGRVVFSGSLETLRREETQRVHVRVKEGKDALAAALRNAGCAVEVQDGTDQLEVELPEKESSDLIWKIALTNKLQIRTLAPATMTMEQAFDAVLEQESGGS
jgi:ABC-2 type transport system ATP-binding protein